MEAIKSEQQLSKEPKRGDSSGERIGTSSVAPEGSTGETRGEITSREEERTGVAAKTRGRYRGSGRVAPRSRRKISGDRASSASSTVRIVRKRRSQWQPLRATPISRRLRHALAVHCCTALQPPTIDCTIKPSACRISVFFRCFFIF